MYSIHKKKNDLLEINGVEHKINATFDNILNVIDLLKENISDGDKLDIAIELLFGKSLDISYKEKYQVFTHIMEEYINQKQSEEEEYDLQGNLMPKYVEDQEAYYSLEHDAKYIYAGFRQAYGINLFEEQGKLHWLDFQALLVSLPEETKFKQLVKLRAWKPKKGDSAEYKHDMREAQKAVALPRQEGESYE